jgi:hypothetical protein
VPRRRDAGEADPAAVSNVSLLISFKADGIVICPIVDSDAEGCELARHFQRLVATLVENPDQVQRLCACQSEAA